MTAAAVNPATAAPSPARPDDWPARPWLLAALLGLAALAVHFASHGGEQVPWRMALTALLVFAPLTAAFSLDRDYRLEPVVFALGAGLVMAGIAWRTAAAGERYSDAGYWVASGIVAVALALPLFQAGFHRLRWRTPYADTHYFVWTDAISAGGALAFTGLSWLVLALLAELFQLLKITLLKDLIDQAWFAWAFSGTAFGAALGTLRNQLKVLGTLQSVVLLVLSLLAVPLALALVVFLLAMIVSGPKVLWEATRSATPVLLACAAGAFVLVNAVIRDNEDDVTRSGVLRGAALVLAVCIFPLTVFAAVSMGTRIAQHGLSPERIWALIAIAVATAYGLACVVSVGRGWRGAWRGHLRQANLHLAAGVGVLALLLALPLADFSALSVRSQLARLASGAVNPDKFDYTALRWDFGDAGRAALRQLAKSKDATIARLATVAEQQQVRPYRFGPDPERRERQLDNLRIAISDKDVADRMRLHVEANPWLCSQRCVAVDLGPLAPGKDGGRARHLALIQGANVQHFLLRPGQPVEQATVERGEVMAVDAAEAGDLAPDARVEVRRFEGRQLYVDGRPVGDPFR